MIGHDLRPGDAVCAFDVTGASPFDVVLAVGVGVHVRGAVGTRGAISKTIYRHDIGDLKVVAGLDLNEQINLAALAKGHNGFFGRCEEFGIRARAGEHDRPRRADRGGTDDERRVEGKVQTWSQTG